MAKSRFAHLFADEKPAPKSVPQVPEPARLEEYDRSKYDRGALASTVAQAEFYAGLLPEEQGRENKYEGRKRVEMLGHDRMLFEGLLLRYGKRWILAELARCLKNFPSYRKDD